MRVIISDMKNKRRMKSELKYESGNHRKYE